MTQQLPCWWATVATIEEHEDMRRRHRADGVLTPEEDAAEFRHLRTVALAAAVRTAANLTLAQAVMRVGPAAPRSRELLAEAGYAPAPRIAAAD